MPRLLVSKEKCLTNMDRMASKAKLHGMDLRPHFKTHQDEEVGSWYRDFGVKEITVSSFSMAERFARSGWKDILVAFPFIPGDIEVLNTLAENRQIGVLVDHPMQVEALGRARQRVDYYIDIDTGYGRTGVPAQKSEAIETLIRTSKKWPRLRFRGFYCHAGHSYRAGGQAERKAIHLKAMTDLGGLKHDFGDYDPLILYGDTPNCSTMEDFGSTDVLTPGNFIYYDLFQHSIASCGLEDIAVSVECPVSGVYPERGQAVIHGGAVHFSKEGLELKGRTIFGQVAGTMESRILSLSQEHGILETSPEFLDKIHIGDTLRILPVHSCLTANLLRESTHII